MNCFWCHKLNVVNEMTFCDHKNKKKITGFIRNYLNKILRDKKNKKNINIVIKESPVAEFHPNHYAQASMINELEYRILLNLENLIRIEFKLDKVFKHAIVHEIAHINQMANRELTLKDKKKYFRGERVDNLAYNSKPHEKEAEQISNKYFKQDNSYFNT